MLIRFMLCKTKDIAVTGLASSLTSSVMLVQEQTELQGVNKTSLQFSATCDKQEL
jgi:hypothetical protein